jgi:arylsulfatase A-like enzyme
MSLGSAWSRLRDLLNHPLSPAPLVVVFVGYWMPLEWFLRGDASLTNCTLSQVLHVVATSALLNFFPAALLTAAIAYVLAGAISLLFRVSFKHAAEKSLGFMAFFVLLGATAEIVNYSIFSLLSAPAWLKAVIVSILLLCSLWLTLRNIKLMQWILIPRYITWAVMPLALILVFVEMGQVWLSRYNIHKTSSVLAETGPNGNRRPDIILITVDTLSAGHLHTYGYSRPTSPHLDDFATGAILFENFYANANWTRPGVASILNGAGPWTHRGDVGIPLEGVTEAQNLINRLADAGYYICVVNSNYFSDLEYQGVETVPDRRAMLYSYTYMGRLLGQRLPSAFLASLVGPSAILNSFGPSILLAAKTNEYLPQSEPLLRNAPSDRPLFFWLHIMSPHEPYATPPPYLGTFEPSPRARTPGTTQGQYHFVKMNSELSELQPFMAGRYDEAVLMADDVIGHILDVLKSQGRFDGSLIVVTADHGQSFDPRFGGHGGPILSEEIIHVPCLIKPPFYRGSKRESLLFDQSDLAPTMLSFAGLPVPAGMEGQAYPSKQNSVPIFSMNHDLEEIETHTLSVALREGDWKYVLHMGPWPYPWPQRELYNIAKDANESTNLVEREPERAESMRQHIMQELARHRVNTKAYQR